MRNTHHERLTLFGSFISFTVLKKCRDDVSNGLGTDASKIELSMGMSGDFEQAIEMGSDNVRVGSSIFGARDYT